MISLSRRQLAQYAVDQLLVGEPLKRVAQQIAAVLIDTKRTQDVELLLTDIAWELERRGKLAEATATSATSLSDKLRTELTLFIKHAADVEQVNLTENIDKNVIGGVRLETAVHSWDKTVIRALTDIREAF